MIQDDAARAIKKILGVNEVPFNVPPKREMGDFSTAVCLSQARTDAYGCILERGKRAAFVMKGDNLEAIGSAAKEEGLKALDCLA